MKTIMPAHIDSPFHFEFKEPRPVSNPLLVLERVAFQYDEQAVLKHVNFQLYSGDRIGLLGRNGAGKSTLIRLLAGELVPSKGSIVKSNQLTIGYFSQHTLDILQENLSALAHLQELTSLESELRLRKFLGGFDFSGDMTLMPVKYFSGGEKARLALALIVWQAPHLLLLDEPTNHLDMDMRQALILALQNFDGAVVLVSHDRFLLDQVVDDYYLISHQSVQKFPGGLLTYYNWLKQEDPAYLSTEVQNEKETQASKTKSPVTEKNTETLLLQRQIRQMEEEIAILQKEIAEFDQQLIELSKNTISQSKAIKNIQIKRAHTAQQYQENEKTWLEIMERYEKTKT